MIRLKAILSGQFRESLRKLEFPVPDEIQFTRNKDSRMGDLSTNLAMMLSKGLKKNPREIAQQIISELVPDPELTTKMVASANGFINVFIQPGYLRQVIRSVYEFPESYGGHKCGNGQKVNVEFVSANPTGPLSLGHGRQAVLGDVISRLLENAGYDVVREYYFNNAGFQMKRLGESVRLRYLEKMGESVDFPDGLYEGSYIQDIADLMAAKYGSQWKDNPSADFRKFAESVLFENIRKDLNTIRLAFDVYYNEDSLYTDGRIDALVAEFRKRGLVYEKEGALWLKTAEFDYDAGQQPETDKVIVKATGEPTYRLPDIAYHITKFERGFDRIIDIFGADHIAQYPDVIAALKKLGYDTSKMHVLIHQFVTLVKEGEILKMSKRKANFVTVAELAETLGVDVFRYFLVMRSHHSHLNFDMELAVSQTMENPVYYVQNAHARICSIEKKAHEKGFDPESVIPDADLSKLTADEETRIISKICDYPELTLRLSQSLEAHPLTTYLEELAGLYHHYQTAGKKDQSLRVVTKDRELTAARLALCRATRVVLSHGLGLLGVTAPGFMSKLEQDED